MTAKLRLEPDPPDTGTTAAEEAVSAFDALVLGQPFAAEADAATEAVGTLRAAATAALFPAIVSASADTIALYEFATATFTKHEFSTQLAGLHQQALDAVPGLAQFLRTGLMLAHIKAAAASTAPAAGEPIVMAEETAVAAYMQTIAGQLVGRPEHEPSATTLATTVPALEARIEACRARHEAHVKGELERIEAETRQAAETIAAAEKQQREELATFFMAKHGRGFAIHGEIFSGAALSRAAKRIGVQDNDGYFVPFKLEELQALRVREEAADQAIAAGGAL
jgi:hypothetical protein